MPAFIRLSLETMGEEFYFGQLLFHLESNGKNNIFFQSCNADQRKFVSDFVEYVINNYAAEVKLNGYENETLMVYNIWSET